MFATLPDGGVRFVPAGRPPTDLEVGRLLATVRRRIMRLVRRHGIALEAGAGEAVASDRLALEEPALAAIAGASVLGRVATGPRAGHLVLRLGADATAPVVTSAGPRHAQREGFDLHANTAVRAGDRRRLEHLCRYILRPPVAGEALELTPDGRVLLRLRRPWRDGTRALRCEPCELLEKLCRPSCAWRAVRPHRAAPPLGGAASPATVGRSSSRRWAGAPDARAPAADSAPGSGPACAP
jgi:hypothetical protein